MYPAQGHQGAIFITSQGESKFAEYLKKY